MSNYRRSTVPGGTWFFTLTLADRRSRLLVEKIALLRQAYGQTLQARPFRTLAICILPDHLPAIWTLPEGDADYSGRWSLLKSTFSRQFPASFRTASKTRKREKVCGSAAFGNTRSATPATCSGMWMTCTSIRSSTG